LRASRALRLNCTVWAQPRFFTAKIAKDAKAGHNVGYFLACFAHVRFNGKVRAQTVAR